MQYIAKQWLGMQKPTVNSSVSAAKYVNLT